MARLSVRDSCAALFCQRCSRSRWFWLPLLTLPVLLGLLLLGLIVRVRTLVGVVALLALVTLLALLALAALVPLLVLLALVALLAALLTLVALIWHSQLLRFSECCSEMLPGLKRQGVAHVFQPAARTAAADKLMSFEHRF